MRMNDRNAEQYHDPTASEAVRNVMNMENEINKMSFLVSCLKFIIRESGFELMSRIELKSKKSGKVYK